MLTRRKFLQLIPTLSTAAALWPSGCTWQPPRRTGAIVNDSHSQLNLTRWSDTHQLSTYIDNYHAVLDKRLGAAEKATEMITEIYVPRTALSRFLEDVRRDFRQNKVNVIFGTLRLIERDDECFLAWAKEPYVCIIFNLHVVHSKNGLEKAATNFRRLIDRGIEYGGSYFLTYHKWATRKQVETCYPQFPEFLRLKKEYDPEERFQSNWYRHYKKMFGDSL